jgi:hypothetical protein
MSPQLPVDTIISDKDGGSQYRELTFSVKLSYLELGNTPTNG